METVYSSLSLTVAVIFIAHGVQASSCPHHVQKVERGYTAVHNNVCYLFVNDEVYWKTARDRCWDLGGEMIAIEDRETMEYIKKKLDSRELSWDREGVWLGARYTSGKWRWTNGRIMSYTNWASGEPSKLFGLLSVEDCSQMRKDDGWQWHDYPCGALNFHYNYICQFPMSKPGDKAGRVASSASNQEEDNGNTSILAIIIGVSAGLLLIMLIIFLLLHVHHRQAKRKANEASVHYSNNGYHTRASEPTRQDHQLPPVPTSRPPVPSNDSLYLTPKEVTGMYAEVSKPRNHLHMVSFPAKTCNCTHVQTGASNSVCSSLGTSPELGACGGLDPEEELQTPLMTTSGKACGGTLCASAGGVATENKCCNDNPNQGEYIDMNSLVMKEGNGKCLTEDEEKHTYSNVDHRDSGIENHYEVLP